MIHRQRKRVLDGSEGSDPSHSTDTGGAGDTFIVDTDDPARANALGSSLWELEALKRHSYPPVAKFVKVFTADFTKPVSTQLMLAFFRAVIAVIWCSAVCRSVLTTEVQHR